GLAGDDGLGLDGVVAPVEPQVGLAGGAVGPVAGEAVLGQDRADVAVVLQLLRGPGAGARHETTEAQGRKEPGGPGSLYHGRSFLSFLCVCVPPLSVGRPDSGRARLQYFMPERMCRAMAWAASFASRASRASTMARCSRASSDRRWKSLRASSCSQATSRK